MKIGTKTQEVIVFTCDCTKETEIVINTTLDRYLNFTCSCGRTYDLNQKVMLGYKCSYCEQIFQIENIIKPSKTTNYENLLCISCIQYRLSEYNIYLSQLNDRLADLNREKIEMEDLIKKYSELLEEFNAKK